MGGHGCLFFLASTSSLLYGHDTFIVVAFFFLLFSFVFFGCFFLPFHCYIDIHLLFLIS
ncbi:uncharacterized protein BDW47DRAFT_105239 [Aspergillus candidus]|uniref:Uncharacterized protein n=1 Tax=Aspergillus candidus TaxID=41067 RepID=A0A2I2FCI8_ASPCN|nr:hypothetical protein BDW47DRAFT_105239 [Aspergillus candidus]PLB38346.1 hypothetical protein BDW47DRAFT_105239 [Aspergillus candidus]